MFVDKHEIAAVDKGKGIVQRMLGHSEQLMLVELTFRKGATFEPHSHEDFSQAMYVLKGKFELICGDTKMIAEPGDVCYAAKNEVHGTLALEDGSVLLDIHSPMRPDYLEENLAALAEQRENPETH